MSDKPKNDKGTTRRRSYSRNGCVQCKKRKAKCDEHKPSCYNCLNSNRECSYRQILKFKDSRSYTIINSELSNIEQPNGISIHKALIPKNDNSKESKIVKQTIPVSKPSADPFTNRLPQVIQNSVSSRQPQQQSLTDIPPIIPQTSTLSNNNQQNLLFNSSLITSALDSITNQQEQQSNLSAQIPSQLDLENSLFSGATNLITDLNGLINSLEIDFNTFDFQTNMSHSVSESSTNEFDNNKTQYTQTSQHLDTNNVKTLSTSIQTPTYLSNQLSFSPSLSNIRFEGISPTNFSIASSDLEDKKSPGATFSDYNDQTPKLQPSPLSSSTNIPLSLTKKRANSENDSKPIKKVRIEEPNHESKSKSIAKLPPVINMFENTEPKVKNNYIKTLSDSLATFDPLKSNSNIRSPTTETLSTTQTTSSKSYFENFALENSKAFPSPNIKTLAPFDYIKSLNKTMSNNDLESLASFFNWNLNSSHAKYLKIFVTHINPNIIPFTTNYAHNAYIKVFLQQAKTSPHLLFAILAISARFEVYQIEHHPELPNYEEKLSYHRKFRTYYLSSCLKSLESVLHSKQTTLNNIESLLLTIQVLASDFSGLKGSQWRAHLHGAKDLLIKYCRYRPLSLELTIVWLWFYSMEVLAALAAPHGGAIHDFDEMDEFLPVLCPDVPQYLKYFRENAPFITDQDLFEPGRLTHALVHFGISIDGTLENNVKSRFNMYLGYNETVLEIFNALVYTIECIRNKNKNKVENKDENENEKSNKAKFYEKKILDSQGKTLNSEFLLSLFAMIKKARSFSYITNEPPYLIPLGQGLHPSEIIKNANTADDYVLDNVFICAYIHPAQVPTANENKDISQDEKSPSKTNLTDSSNVVRSKEESPENDSKSTLSDQLKPEVYFSWIDLSQQLNTDASFLRLLTLHGGISTYGLGLKSSLVQDVVNRMISGLYGLIRYKEEIKDDFELQLLNKRYETLENFEADELNDNDISNLSSWHEFPFDRYLDYQFDNRLVMVPWSLYICGLCCIEPKHKAIIECIFVSLVELGVGSAEFSLKKLRKIWTLQKLKRFDYEKFDLFGQEIDGNDEEDDYVLFM